MARAKTVSTPNRRGSPEAVEKRRAGRLFNDVLGGRSHVGPKLDGRTEKRRQRLLKELKEGTQPQAAGSEKPAARQLKPLDVLQHVQELLDLGEPLTSIRKAVKVKKNPPAVDGIHRIVERLHKAYSFRPEVYRFVGIGEDVLRSAGVLESQAREPREARVAARKKPAAKRR